MNSLNEDIYLRLRNPAGKGLPEAGPARAHATTEMLNCAPVECTALKPYQSHTESFEIVPPDRSIFTITNVDDGPHQR